MVITDYARNPRRTPAATAEPITPATLGPMACKKTAPDGRRRQYYQITEQGWRYVDELTGLYRRFIGGVELLLEGGEAHGE